MTKNKLPLSVIILTHRHDHRFIKALASAQPAAEVLILDYQSQNDWLALAKKYQFKLIKRTEKIQNFSQERNLALTQAQYDWVFFLDSDEEIISDSWSEIAQAITTTQFAGFWVNRIDIFHGKALSFGETGKSKFLRLVKKAEAKYLRPVHEKAMVTGKTTATEIYLNHYSHLNIKEFITDITHYAELEAEYQTDDLLNPLILGLKTIIYPKGKFINNYFFKLGFLDGWRGVVYAMMMSLHSIMVRVFSYENR